MYEFAVDAHGAAFHDQYGEFVIELKRVLIRVTLTVVDAEGGRETLRGTDRKAQIQRMMK